MKFISLTTLIYESYHKICENAFCYNEDAIYCYNKDKYMKFIASFVEYQSKNSMWKKKNQNLKINWRICCPIGKA